MTPARTIRSSAALLLLLATVAACAPGRSIVRGNWPDGRLETTGAATRVVRRPPPPPPPAEPVDEWVAADPMPALSAAELNRMGVLQTVHFGFDSDAVTTGAQDAIIQANAAWLLENPTARIIIEGHCDERGTRRYNLDLGQRRAESARAALIQAGVNPERIEVVSYGEELPAEETSTEAAWAANRRADFIIVAIDS